MAPLSPSLPLCFHCQLCNFRITHPRCSFHKLKLYKFFLRHWKSLVLLAHGRGLEFSCNYIPQKSGNNIAEKKKTDCCKKKAALCPNYEMSSIKWPIHQMYQYYLSYILYIKCPTIHQMSYPLNVLSIKCPIHQMYQY